MKNKGLTKEELPWNKLGVIVCSKCKTLFSKGELKESQDCGESLKNTLKARLKAKDLLKDCRVMTSSCQNFCEDNRQAVTFFDAKAGGSETYSLHPEKDLEELFELILGKIGPTKD